MFKQWLADCWMWWRQDHLQHFWRENICQWQTYLKKNHDSKSLATKLSNLHFWWFFLVENSPQSSRKPIAGLRQPRVRLGVLPPQKTKVLLPHGHILILWIHVPLHPPNFVVPYGLRSAELIKTYESHRQVPSVWILKGPSSSNKKNCWGHTYGCKFLTTQKKQTLVFL